MDVRDYIAASAADFSRARREWLAIPSVSADPPLHAPNEQVDLSRLLRGAESVAYLWEELAGVSVADQ
jgi:hypothetical protein